MSDELKKIAGIINKLNIAWSLSFIGEDQLSKLDTLTKYLKGTSFEKQVAPGFSYWGIGPTIAWLSACDDPFYPVMFESTKHFSELWAKTLPFIDSQKYHYVSLGVGTGKKDHLILQGLYRLNRNLCYFPVDMSPEMLRIGARGAIEDTPIKRGRTLPLQIDFSNNENAEALRAILDGFLGDKNPILFSLLGNTVSNFDADTNLLKTIRDMIRPQDKLLLEVAFTSSVGEEAQREAAEEYDRSRKFKQFVSSSLHQNTDLSVNIDNVAFVGTAEKDRAILVKALYRNTGESLTITLPNRDRISFPEDDSIRLLTMRKYTDEGINEMVRECRFSLLSRVKRNYSASHQRFKFGVELLLLGPSEVTEKKAENFIWDIFLSHADADLPVAEKLFDLLAPRCKIFLDKRSLEFGVNWDEEVPLAQRNSLVSVIVVSSNTEQAYYQKDEIAAAIRMARLDKDKHRVVPIFLDDPADANIPFGLRLKQGIQLSPDTSIKAVAEQLLQLLNKLK